MNDVLTDTTSDHDMEAAISLAESAIREMHSLDSDGISPDSSAVPGESSLVVLAGSLSDYKFYREKAGQIRIVGSCGAEQTANVVAISFDHELVRLTEIRFEDE